MTRPMRPVKAAIAGLMMSQPAVIATSPARAPFRAKLVAGFLNRIHDTIMAPTAPPAADRFVVTAI